MAVKWWMDDAEIANSYRMAADKKNQIRVLADLNATKPVYVRAKLAELGCLSEEEAGEEPKKELNDIQIDEAEARRLIEAGTPDEEIAEQLGVSKSIFLMWRRAAGIFRYRSAPLDDNLAMQMFNDGLSDEAMAEALDVSVGKIKLWRSKNHLERKRGGARNRKEKTEMKHFGMLASGEFCDEEASCQQVEKAQESEAVPQKYEAEATTAASETCDKPVKVREMFALCERIMNAGFGDAPLRIDGDVMNKIYAVSFLNASDGVSVELTTTK